QRPRLEDFEDGLQLSGRKPFADLGDHSRQLARAQRREHAMPRLDTPVERRRNRIRQRFESARRPDDHNIGLHPDSLCATPKPAARLQLTPRASDAASRRAAESGLCPIDSPLSPARRVWLNLVMEACANQYAREATQTDAAISDCR